MFVQCPSQVNCHDEDSLTPLHYAARYNHLEIVQLLVAKGAGERLIPVLASGITIFFQVLMPHHIC